MVIVAAEDIPKFTELTYDYGSAYIDNNEQPVRGCWVVCWLCGLQERGWRVCSWPALEAASVFIL